jgi:biotin carboxyl carrier protein
LAREWTFFDRSEEMRTEVKAPMGGKVISVLVRVEDQVETRLKRMMKLLC